MRRLAKTLSIIALALTASTLPGRSENAATSGGALQVAEAKAAAPEFIGL